MADEMRERIARALGGGRVAPIHYDMAAAVLAAMRTPTPGMVEAIEGIGLDRDPLEYWQAMIDAA